ncbi:MAG: DNA primase [Oscillospiraceae bacterium]|jgi:DNA primase|nr:DNA primase [Oscillospiraceae bacterium]
MINLISRFFLEQLKNSCPVEEIVSSYLNLKPLGNNKFVGLCPFHSEKTPSFVVYSATQSFFCFGCQVGGDVVSFIKKMESLDYVGALKFLANKSGIGFPEDEIGGFNFGTRILSANKEAARFFHGVLKETDFAMNYLKKERKVCQRTVVKFGLGFAPKSWDSLGKHLFSKGFSLEELLAAKLLTKAQNGSIYDIFRNRIIFPIINSRAEVLGFGGRVLDESRPKYLNSYDSLVFKKSNNLFNINLAKKSKQIILVEGYFDAISIVQAGFGNVVATLGTALTINQAKLISVYAEEVILAYDSDEAGVAATYKAMNILNGVGLATKVLDLSNFKDPDEYIKNRGDIRFKMALANSVDAIDFKLNNFKVQFDINTSAGKVAFLKAAAALLAQLNNRLTRDVYLGKISSEMGIDKQILMSHVNNLIKIHIKKRKSIEQKNIARNFVGNKRPRSAGNTTCLVKSEELIIRSLYGNNSLFEILKSNCPFELFVSENKDIYEVLMYNIEHQLPVEMPCITGLNSDLLAVLSRILAKNFDFQLDFNGILECVKTLKKAKQQLNAAGVSKMAAEELKGYIEDLAKQKRC